MIKVSILVMPGSRIQKGTSSPMPLAAALAAVPRIGESVTLANGWEYRVRNVDHDLRTGDIWVILGDSCA